MRRLLYIAILISTPFQNCEAGSEEDEVFFTLVSLMLQNEAPFWERLKFGNEKLKTDLVVQCNRITDDFLGREVAFLEKKVQSSVITLLQDDYIFGYDIKSYIMFTNIKVSRKKARLTYKVILDKGSPAYSSIEYTTSFIKKGKVWRIS